MSIKDCIGAYTRLSETVFKKKHHRLTGKANLQGSFDTPALERAIKDIVTGSGLQENALLRDDDESACKV